MACWTSGGALPEREARRSGPVLGTNHVLDPAQWAAGRRVRSRRENKGRSGPGEPGSGDPGRHRREPGRPSTSAAIGSCSSRTSSRPPEACGASMAVSTARATLGSWQSRETLPRPGFSNHWPVPRRSAGNAGGNSRGCPDGASAPRRGPNCSIQPCSSGGTACESELTADPVRRLGENQLSGCFPGRARAAAQPPSPPPTITRSAASSPCPGSAAQPARAGCPTAGAAYRVARLEEHPSRNRRRFTSAC